MNGIISIFAEYKLQTNTTGVCIHLDKSTAIKFAKTLRTEINKITESEVQHG
jgi:lactam utilization protein B